MLPKGPVETPTETPTPCLTPGTLDTTFDGDGKVITRISEGNLLRSIALQSDGKIVGVGSAGSQFLVIRYNSDGSLDDSFNNIGYSLTDFGGDSSSGVAITIQSDGRIVAVGSVLFGFNNDFAIARYNPDGSFDNTFADNGKLTMPVPGPHGDRADVATAVSVLSDGKMLVAGYIPNGSGTGSDFCVVRYNSDGSVDLTFGFGGKTAVSIGKVNHAGAMAIQTDGKILVAGQTDFSLSIARFNPDGTIDTSFAGDGTMGTTLKYPFGTADLAIQNDNRILTVGKAGNDFAVARVNVDGSFDTSFGNNGIAATSIDGGGTADSVVVQTDGQIVAGGYSSTGFVMVRYDSDGSLDSSFGADGIATTSFGEGATIQSIVKQPDGKITAAGWGSFGSQTASAIARYRGASCGESTPTETLTSTPTLMPTDSPSPTSTLTNTPTATPTAIPNSSCTFDNGGTAGGLNPNALTESGVAAPEGYFWSEVQHNAGNLDEANSAAGWNARQGYFRLADNFSIAQPCRINTIDLYGYVINAPATPSPFTACTLRIWKGRPGDLGSKVVFGDTTTNRLAASVDSTFLRIFNTVAPPPGTKPVETNKIWKNTITAGVTLSAGTYWLDWASTTSDEGNHYYPSKTISGSRGELLDDARQLNAAPFGHWSNAIDHGMPASAAAYSQDFPFNVNGVAASPTPTATETATLTPTSTPATPPTDCDLTENFDDISALSAAGWPEINNSSPIGNGIWFQGSDEVFVSHEGASSSYIAVNYQSGNGNSSLSNWLLTPPLLLQNGGQFTFWTRTVDNPAFPDRLQVRMSTNGTSTDVGTSSSDVGDFTALLLDINPAYMLDGYPNTWTQYVVTITGLGSPVKGRLAFRYFVENGGPSGNNSDYLGIDSVTYDCAPITPTPTTTSTDTPTDTPSSTPTDTATPTESPVITGVVTYGNAKSPPQFVSHVTISGSGSNNISTTTGYPDGMYSLSGFGFGPYIVTPSKPAGTQNGITSFDAAKIAQHVTGSVPLTGNQLLVADVSDNGEITSFDASQIARFVISSPPYGITGTWKFLPASRDYSSVSTSMSGENFIALLMGDVSGNWSDANMRPANGPVQSIAVGLPDQSDQTASEVVIPVTVKGATKKDLISYEFDLRYDPSVIKPQLNPIDLSKGVSRGFTAVTSIAEPGLLRVAAYGSSPINFDGVLLDLKFTAVGQRPSFSPLIWERIMFNEGDGVVATANGRVELSAAVTDYH